MRFRVNRVAFLITAIHLCAATAQAESIRMAVSYFENLSKKRELDSLKKGFAEMLITDMSVSDDLVIVERARLNAVLGEIKLQRNPYFDRKSASKLGKGLGATYILTGSYLLFAETLRVDSRLIDVETSEVVLSVKEEGKVEQFFDLERRLATRLLKGLGAKLTLVGKKRIGQQSTRKFEAFQLYSQSLGAKDRGDRGTEKRVLRKALALDPGFLSVKKRLSKIEQKVSALEKSGGLILAPSSAKDHFHNAKIHHAEGRYEKARLSTVAALRKDPRLVEPWILFRELPKPGHINWTGMNVSAKQQKVLRAYLKDDLDLLQAQVRRGSDSQRLLAAVLLFSRIPKVLPLATSDQAIKVSDAIQQLTSHKGPPPSSAFAFINRQRFMASVKVFQKETARFGRQMQYGVAVRIQNPSQKHSFMSWWRLAVVMLESPHSAVTIKVVRQTRHPHWKKTQIPTMHLAHVPFVLRTSNMTSFNRTPRSIARHRADLSKLLTRVELRPLDNLLRWNPKTDVTSYAMKRYGEPIKVFRTAIRCTDDRRSVTGKLCRIAVHLFKGNLLPGCYAVTVSYKGSDGRIVTRRHPWVWATEYKIVRSSGLRKKRRWTSWGLALGPKRLVHRITAENVALYEKRPEFRAVRFAPKYTTMVCSVHAEGRFYKEVYDTRRPRDAREKRRRINAIARYPGQSLRYDIDRKLIDNKNIANEDFKAWIDYGRKIMRRGAKMSLPNYECAFVPLPELPPGPHTICLMSKYINGAVSPEPECMQFDIGH